VAPTTFTLYHNHLLKTVNMKKYITTLLLLVLVTGTLLAQNKQATPTNAAAFTKTLAGHWQKGVFSLSSFEEHNGKYVGPANETSLSYVIDNAGNASEYFISNINSYNCRTQILGYRTGKLVVHKTENVFEFQPTSGYYTTLTCMSKSTAKKPYTAKDLYPTYRVQLYLDKDANGAPVLVTKNAEGTKGLELQKMKQP
jgi:hypothetical protein